MELERQYGVNLWEVEDKTWETLLRERWDEDQTWILANIISQHKLSFNFLREFRNKINWTWILTGGHRVYCGEEKMKMISEFGLERREERHMHQTLVIWEKNNDI